MADLSQLGEIIGGMGASRQKSFDAGVETAANARYRSAQTEDALTQARVNQAAAIKAEQVNQQRAEVEAMRARGELDFANPTNDMLARGVLGDLAENYVRAGDFNLDAQQYRNRATMADPAASALNRTRAAQAVEGKPSSDIVAVGSNGVTNLTDEVPELTTMAGLDDFASPAGKLLRDRLAVIAKYGEGSAQLRMFDEAASKLATAGGVPIYAQPFTPPSAPAAPGAAPAAAVPTARNVVDPSTVATNLQNNANAKTVGTQQGKLQVALPGVMEGMDTFEADVDAFLASPGFDTVYGRSGAFNETMVPVGLQGEDYRNARVQFEKLGAQGFLQSVQKMRGLGALSDAEGSRVEKALTAALNAKGDEEQARVLWGEFKTRLARLRQVAEQEAGAQAAPAAGGNEFATMTDDELRAIIAAGGG